MLRPGLTQGKVACGQWCRAAGSLRDLNERVSAPGENAWDDLKTVDPSSQSWVPADTQTWRLKKKTSQISSSWESCLEASRWPCVDFWWPASMTSMTDRAVWTTTFRIGRMGAYAGHPVPALDVRVEHRRHVRGHHTAEEHPPRHGRVPPRADFLLRNQRGQPASPTQRGIGQSKVAVKQMQLGAYA